MTVSAVYTCPLCWMGLPGGAQRVLISLNSNPQPAMCGATSGDPCWVLDLLSAQLETTFLEELLVLQKTTNPSHDSVS